jgi:hypothetical protein
MEPSMLRAHHEGIKSNGAARAFETKPFFPLSTKITHPRKKNTPLSSPCCGELANVFGSEQPWPRLPSLLPPSSLPLCLFLVNLLDLNLTKLSV